METLNFGGVNLPISDPAGLLHPVAASPSRLAHNVGGIAGTRMTFDFFALNEAEATGNGGPPTIGNPATL